MSIHHGIAKTTIAKVICNRFRRFMDAAGVLESWTSPVVADCIHGLNRRERPQLERITFYCFDAIFPGRRSDIFKAPFTFAAALESKSGSS